METPVYQFKIMLSHTKPPIWRRFRVHGDITFRQLHRIVQIVMGWKNHHLYMFWSGSDQFSEPKHGFGDKPVTLRLDEFVQREGDVLKYLYDFGDSWEHKIVLEKILTDSNKPVPLCTHGRRACPPEDCGGVWGYRQLLEAKNSRQGNEYEEYLDWLGEDFDPIEFDIEGINKRLADPRLSRN